MSLEKRLDFLMKKHKVRPDSLLDQSFMIDESMIKRIVDASEIRPGESVIEIGAGMGFLTKELAKTKARVIAIEIDKRLETILKDELKGTGVNVVCGNILSVIRKIEFDKIVSNIPYSICESLVQRLTALEFKGAYLSVPKTFAYRLLKREGLGLIAQTFFDIEILFDIPKKAFMPTPKANTVFIRIEHRDEDYYKNHLNDFILRELILQKTKKLRNAFREALINKDKLLGKKLTKKEANETIKSLNLNNELLEQKMKHTDLKTLVDIINVKQLDKKIR